MSPGGAARVRKLIAAVALLAFALAGTVRSAGASGPGPSRPMRDEDVVRMLVTGRSVPEIVSEIRARPVRFDLSDDMVEELHLAGVPAEVLRAMRERQEEMERGREHGGSGTTEDKHEGGGALVRIRFCDGNGGGAPTTLRIPLRAPAEMAAALGTPSDPQALRVTAAAVFLACRTADHVPDHWRNRSPLGRDFLSMPRHRMLAFAPGGEMVSRGNHTVRDPEKARFLRFVPPRELTASLEPGVAHDLIVGLALEIGGRYLQVASGELPGVVIEKRDRVFQAILHRRRKAGVTSYGIELRELPGDDERNPAAVSGARGRSPWTRPAPPS